ncbi:MAG: 50S ribosomal protein L23 [Candidatus Nanoarchaeia archaeon]|nr:50S ribosomal protein L23 [Candidatus Nanoarchaeia archaeon]
MSSIIKYPLINEKTLKLLREDNTLVFVVDRRFSKLAIRSALEELYELKIANINTLVDVRGNKKAFVRLTDEQIALEIATNLGLM